MDFLCEQTETNETANISLNTEETEQTEISGELNDKGVNNFIVENRNKNNQNDAR